MSQHPAVNIVIVFTMSLLAFFAFFPNARHYLITREGMSMPTLSMSSSSAPIPLTSIDKYIASVKTEVIRLQDTLLVSKYKSSYEEMVLELDDLVDNLMLQTATGINPSNPMEGITRLNALMESKQSLSSVMKFIGQ